MVPAHHDIYEQEARRRSWELENMPNPKLPQGFTEHYYPLTRTERLQLQRLATAWRLAPDIRTLEDLLFGIPVDPSRLNPTELARARTASLVQLIPPIDTLAAA